MNPYIFKRLLAMGLTIIVTVESGLTSAIATEGLAQTQAQAEAVHGERLETSIFRAFVATKLLEIRVRNLNFPKPSSFHPSFLMRNFGDGGLQTYVGLDNSTESMGSLTVAGGIPAGVAFIGMALQGWQNNYRTFPIVLTIAGLAMIGAASYQSFSLPNEGTKAVAEVEARIQEIESNQKIQASLNATLNPICDAFMLIPKECQTIASKVRSQLVQKISSDLEQVKKVKASGHHIIGEPGERLERLLKTGQYPILLGAILEEQLNSVGADRKEALTAVINGISFDSQFQEQSKLAPKEVYIMNVELAKSLLKPLEQALGDNTEALTPDEVAIVKTATEELNRNIKIAELMQMNVTPTTTTGK